MIKVWGYTQIEEIPWLEDVLIVLKLVQELVVWTDKCQLFHKLQNLD